MGTANKPSPKRTLVVPSWSTTPPAKRRPAASFPLLGTARRHRAHRAASALMSLGGCLCSLAQPCVMTDGALIVCRILDEMQPPTKVGHQHTGR